VGRKQSSHPTGKFSEGRVHSSKQASHGPRHQPTSLLVTSHNSVCTPIHPSVSPTGNYAQGCGLSLTNSGPFQLRLLLRSSPSPLSSDYFKHSSLSRTLFPLPMLLRSPLLFLCQRNANLHEASTSKTPLHAAASSALYFGRWLFLGTVIISASSFCNRVLTLRVFTVLNSCGEAIMPEPQDHAVCSLCKYPASQLPS